MKEKPITTKGPHDRLTRMCDAICDSFDNHPEHLEEDKCIIMVDDGEMGGLVVHGYESLPEALADLMMHARALFNANGINFEFHMIGDRNMS